ncbi:MAG: hypothetical protein V2A79_15570 [Planctomycetota bacterium]
MSEHAVLAYLPLSNGAFGTADERDSIHELSDRLEAWIKDAGVGEFDGDEFGGGECTLFMYGPDPDALFAAVAPILSDSPHAKGGYVIKRYGAADDTHTREVRIEL